MKKTHNINRQRPTGMYDYMTMWKLQCSCVYSGSMELNFTASGSKVELELLIDTSLSPVLALFEMTSVITCPTSSGMRLQKLRGTGTGREWIRKNPVEARKCRQCRKCTDSVGGLGRWRKAASRYTGIDLEVEVLL